MMKLLSSKLNVHEMKQQFTIGQRVYNKTHKKAGEVIDVSDNNKLYQIKCDNNRIFWEDSDSLLLLEKPNAEKVFDRTTNIPIRNIKSLIKKSKVSPSDNQAEEKAIDLYINMVHTLSDEFMNINFTSCHLREDDVYRFKQNFKHLEKMALEFYKTIKP